jgi:hypothetical protein
MIPLASCVPITEIYWNPVLSSRIQNSAVATTIGAPDSKHSNFMWAKFLIWQKFFLN